MSFILKPKFTPRVLIDARAISPDKFANRRLDDVRSLEILEGGVSTTLDTVFDVEGPSISPNEAKTIEIVIEGSGEKLCYVGYKMSGGRIVARGGLGHFVGYKMKGGTIVVHGDVRNYLGSKMVNGTIEIYGNAGHRVGSKLHGEKPGKGMKGGTIHIHGNAGSEVGWGASGGTIIVDGNAGNFVGADMTGGTIIVKGSAGIYPGLRMKSGRIVIGSSIRSLLPSFYVDSVVPSLKVRGIVLAKPFVTLVGDAIVMGRGLLHISYADNEALLEPYKHIIDEVKAWV